ncbi:MAG: response regulator [Cyclobacteriaceae bacterium]
MHTRLTRFSIILILLFKFTFGGLAQTAEVDSLKSILIGANKVEEQLKLLDQIAKRATFSNLDTAEYYSNRLLKLAIENNLNDYKVNAYHKLGDVYRRRNNTDEALRYAIKADSLVNTQSQRTKIHNLYGNIYFFNNNYEKAASSYIEAMEIAKKEQLPEDIITNMNGLSMTYFRMDEYPEAIAINLDALTIIDSLDLDTRKGSIFGVIGASYQNLGEYGKSYDYYQEAIKSDSLLGDPRGMITWKINWAIALQNDKGTEAALKMYFKALEDSKSNGFDRLTSNVLCNIGAAYQREKMFQKSIEYFEQGYALASSIQAKNLIAFSLQNLGMLAIQMYDSKKAINYLLKGKELAYQINEPSMIRDIHLTMANYFELIGRFDSAYFNLQKYTITKDSIINESKLSEIGKLEAEFEYDKQKLIDEQEHQQELAVEQAKQRTQQIILIITLVSASIIIVLLIIIYRRLQLISKQKLIIEEQKKEVEAKSEKLQGLDIAKSNFFSNISHDLRSPLTLILGSIDQVLEEEGLSASGKQLLESGYRNSKKLLLMTDEIRDLSRLQEGKMELKLQLVRIDAYLNLLLKMFNSAAILKRIVLKFNNELVNEKVVRIDSHQFEKIIYNLLSNAVKHTEELGTITVSIREYEKQSGKILIQISDTGIGIPEHLTRHVFDRYYQVPSQLPGETVGLGIGLALCKEIVELHKGEIWVESSENEGTTFSILIDDEPNASLKDAIIDEYYDPIYSPMEITDNESLELRNENHSQTILVVEDHREIRQFISHILTGNYNVLLAKNGQEALALLQKEKVDLIISDLMMPYMDGFELIKELKVKEAYQHIPVLIVSARTNEEDKLNLLELGAEDVMAKPFSPNELKLRISNALQKKGSNENIFKLFEPNNLRSNIEQVIIKKLENLILSRIDDPNLSVIDLSSELAASERKVFRLIKKIFNMTPLELIKETRWKYLQEYMLKSEPMNATEAGLKIGISNVTYFKKSYFKRFGEEYAQVTRK